VSKDTGDYSESGTPAPPNDTHDITQNEQNTQIVDIPHLLDPAKDVLWMEAVVLQADSESEDSEFASHRSLNSPEEQHAAVRADLVVGDDIANLEANIAD